MPGLPGRRQRVSRQRVRRQRVRGIAAATTVLRSAAGRWRTPPPTGGSQWHHAAGNLAPLRRHPADGGWASPQSVSW